MIGKKSNWDIADKLLSKEGNISHKPNNQSIIPRDGKFMESPKGVISRIRSEQIQSRAALEFDREWYNSQLEVSKHQLKKAVELKKKETDAEIERLLTDISRKHLQYLTELGLKNSAQREEALEKLSDQTALRIKRLQQKDWPDSLIEQTINGVITLHQRFFDKILEE